MRYAVIMAGGSGKRLWPMSRQGQPKQLLPLFNGESLLQLAWQRVSRVVDAANILVCTGAAYADVVATQLPDLRPDNLLGEPIGRDSLNAVAWPSAVLERKDPDAVVAMVTADQLISPVENFVESLNEAFAIAETDPTALVTFGVVPTSPHTGYGYLERGADLEEFAASHVKQFHEKPDELTAKRYVESGNYWWNAGMFVWRAATFNSELATLLPANFDKLQRLAEHPDELTEIFPTLTKISVDYAVMEPVSRGEGAAHVVVVPLVISWADVGNVEALREVLDQDEAGNAVIGDVSLLDAAGNLVVNTDPDTVVAAAGISDCAIVRTPTATLVVPLAQAQRVKQMAEQVAGEFGERLG